MAANVLFADICYFNYHCFYVYVSKLLFFTYFLPLNIIARSHRENACVEINVREYRRGKQVWTIQRHRTQKIRDEDEQIKKAQLRQLKIRPTRTPPKPGG